MSHADQGKDTPKNAKRKRAYFCFPFHHPRYGHQDFDRAIKALCNAGFTPIICPLYYIGTTGNWALDQHILQATIEACECVIICASGWAIEDLHLTARQLEELHYAKSIGKRVLRVPCLD